MNEHGLRDLVFALQALRRRVERDASTLGGALGVAARLFPHQVANVARVLGDLGVRHLLADEVGLGKTIQALMILNALRLQRPSLRTAILVPDTLVVQWREEIRTRAHVAPADDIDPRAVGLDSDSQQPRLLWPERLARTPRVAELLRGFDFLIIDELQLFTEELQRSIVAAAGDVDHVLLLTATPGFHDSTRSDRLFRIIEPTRAALAHAGTVFDALRAREARAAELLARGDWESAPLGGLPSSLASRRVVALAHCAVRRVVRTRRDAWRRYMPRRIPKITLVEPTSAEKQRQKLMWQYFHYLGELSREFALPQLAQRVLRSPASLRQRVTYLKGHGHERQGLLAKVQPLLSPDHGDSRFDELCDTLNEIWSDDPTARVLVCAGDNLTVDDLADRLPGVFDAMPSVGCQIEVARLRNQTRGPDAIVPSEDVIAQAVERFRLGTAQVLIAADVGSSGLNLQCTRHLVLYSIPWDPHEVEQWIGRIDRIGNTAVVTEAGDLVPIIVHVIAHRGLVDERIVEIMRATTILERSISLDPARVKHVSESIQAAALSRDQAAWTEVLEGARELGASREIEELNLPLASGLPWNTDWAIKLLSDIDDAPPTSPVIGDTIGTGYRARERALLGWINAMGMTGEYDVRRTMSDVISLGYVDRGRPAWHVSQVARRPLDESLISRPRGVIYFRANRDDLAQPPTSEYVHPHRGKQVLFFMDHGSPAHENILDVWLRSDGETLEQRFSFRPPDGHALSGFLGAALCVVIARLDPSALVPDPDESNPSLCAAVEADRRFLLQHLRASLLYVGVAVGRDGTLVAVSDDIVKRLLAPTAQDKLLSVRAAAWRNPKWLIESTQARAIRHARSSAVSKAEAAWGGGRENLQQAVEERCYILEVERADRLARTGVADSQASADAIVRRQTWLRDAAMANARSGVILWRTVWCLLE